MAQPKVFVSHSHVDDAFAERLVKDLRAAGADAWLDKNDLGAGDFQARISAALSTCEWFVLVLTRNALASNWVVQEVNAANSLKHAGQLRDLIFLQAGPLEHRELPALWRVFNIFDATADYRIAFDHTMSAMGVTVSTALPPPYESSPSQEPTRPNSQVFALSQDDLDAMARAAGLTATNEPPMREPAIPMSEILAVDPDQLAAQMRANGLTATNEPIKRVGARWQPPIEVLTCPKCGSMQWGMTDPTWPTSCNKCGASILSSRI